LEVSDLEVRYGPVSALRSVAFTLEPGARLAVLGPNGAGKSSLANAISGLVPAASGSIRFDGREVARMPTNRRVSLGLGHLPDVRAIFPGLTVAENLRLFFHQSKSVRDDVSQVFEIFPSLERRRTVPAGRLSGGEQQMLAFSRFAVAPPRLLVLDELSHGLAPGIVAQLFDMLATLTCTLVIIEQYVTRAIELADEVLVLSHGEQRHYGPADGFTSAIAEELYSLHIDQSAIEGDQHAQS
jgi:branched-chain amino acid transport system ATP-binding protein